MEESPEDWFFRKRLRQREEDNRRFKEWVMGIGNVKPLGLNRNNAEEVVGGQKTPISGLN